jgi:hypothetical protein
MDKHGGSPNGVSAPPSRRVSGTGTCPTLPNRLKARLFAAFDLTVLWNKTSGQATVSVEITDATLKALPAILNPDQDGYHDTNGQPEHPAPIGPLDEHPRVRTVSHRAETGTALMAQPRSG